MKKKIKHTDVNSNNLASNTDPGRDGTSQATLFARDAMSYSLNYFEGDYQPIVASNSNMFVASNATSLIDLQKKNLYNGNIGMMLTTIINPNTSDILPLGTVYSYDQLNRLKHARSYNNVDLSANSWQNAGVLMYENTFNYDANGNIEKQVRRNEFNDIIDSLNYKYHKNSNNKLVRNRLYHVQELQTVTSAIDDIEDMGTFYSDGNINVSNNYAYDEEGRLIKDMQEQIASIEWRVDGKVKRINRSTGSTKKSLSFDYDAMGHRIAKHVYNNVTGILEKSTYYVLDAQGNAMSVYERVIDQTTQLVTFEQTEKYIYGSSRVGVVYSNINLLGTGGTPYTQTTWTHTIGKRNYELANHLGNVLSVISDKVIPHANGTTVDYYIADVRQSSDYSPFGVQLSGRNFVKSGAKEGRFGYQGSEEDDEIKGDGNSYTTFYRQLDPRLGRWFSIDPIFQPWQSPYCSMDNNPISFNDPMGDKIGFGKAKDMYETDKKEGETYDVFKKRFNEFKRATKKDLRYLRHNSETFRSVYKDLKKSKSNEYIIKSTEGGSNYDHEHCEVLLNRTDIEPGENSLSIKLAHELGHTWRKEKGFDLITNPYELGSVEYVLWDDKNYMLKEKEAFHMELIFCQELGIETRDIYGTFPDNNSTNTYYSKRNEKYYIDKTKNIITTIGKINNYDYANKVKGYHYKQLLTRSIKSIDVTKYLDLENYE